VGSTVYLKVSDGPEIEPVTVPNVIGLDRYSAEARLNERGLVLGTVSEVESDYRKGAVIWQSQPQGTPVEPGTRIYLQVSLGPAEKPSPSPSPSPSPTETPEA
jgi:serine/threonine-protein kinase